MTGRAAPGRASASALYAARGVASRGVSLVATFVETLLIYRALDPAEAGRFFVSYAVLAGVATVGRYGLDSLLLKLSAARAGAAGGLLKPTLTFTVMSGCVGGAGMFLFCLFYVRQASWWALAFYASTVLATNLAVIAGSLLRGVGRIAAGSIAEMGSVFAITSVLLLGALASGVAIDLDLVLVIFSSAAWLTAAWAVPLATLSIPSRRAAVSVRDALHEYGTGLRQFMITALGYFLFARAPQIILLADPVQSAYFGVAAQLASLVAAIPTIQASYLSPRFADLFHRGELGALNRLIRRSTLAGTAVAGVIALPLVTVPKLVLHVYKPHYADAWLALVILALSTAVTTALGPVQGLLVTCGFERRAARITLWTLGGGIVLMLLGLPGGASAVALAVSVASLGFSLVGAFWLQRTAGIASSIVPLRTSRDSARGGG